MKKRNAKLLYRVLCFLLSAGCVGFQLLTGGRSSFLGVFAAAVVAYMAYDIIICNSFRHWILQGIMLGVCTLVLFPAVYGCVRYLPTILHHPVWFQGEYNEGSSIRSYDPWDSERYISFEEAFNADIGRMLEPFGIRLRMKAGKLRFALPTTLSAQAAEYGDPGSSPDNPVYYDAGSSVNIRMAIYSYYASHLNLFGHGGGGVYICSKSAGAEPMEIGHAHNMFLQIAYNYGIIVGILFLGWNLWCFLRLLLRKDLTGIICAAFLAAILTYGFAEIAVTTGQITLVLLFIIYYFGMQRKEKSI